MKLPKYANVRSHWEENKELLESQAYNECTLNQLKVLKYLYFRLKWDWIGKKSKKMKKAMYSNYVVKNNGELSVPMSVIKKDLGVGSQHTISKAIHHLVGRGFIEITRYGSKKTTHLYRILVVPACNHSEIRWTKYPIEDWYDEAPKRVEPIKNGEDTWRTNFKNKPKRLVAKSDNKPSQLVDKANNNLFG